MIIQNAEYIGKENAVIDHDEYVETVANIHRIQQEAIQFIDDYCSHISGRKRLHEKEFERRYHFSPLKYFHRELTDPFSGATLERQTGSWCAG